MAGLAGFGFPAAPFLGIYQFVGTFLKSVVNIFVAGLAGFRANVGWS
jgi:hypothetical protein